MGLTAKGRQRHQNPHRSFHRRPREEPPPREKARCRVEAAQHRTQDIAQPPQRNTSETGRAEQQQIVQQAI